MSTLTGVRRHLREIEERRLSPQLRRVGLVLILILAAVVGAAEMHLLPTYSVDDVGSILFAQG